MIFNLSVHVLCIAECIIVIWADVFNILRPCWLDGSYVLRLQCKPCDES